MKKNAGRFPAELEAAAEEGKILRVHVELRNGYKTKGVEPHGWPANGRGACRWTLSDHAFDVILWELNI